MYEFLDFDQMGDIPVEKELLIISYKSTIIRSVINFSNLNGLLLGFINFLLCLRSLH